MKVLNNYSDYRYERKYVIEHTSLQKVFNYIKCNPGIFSKIYQARYVNNIYFDSMNYDSFKDNVVGISKRQKVRIRWYYEGLNDIKNPILEVKSKNGYLGRKYSYPIHQSLFKKNGNFKELNTLSKNSNIPMMYNHFKPVLINRYKRFYFLSVNKKFRITVDTDLSFTDIGILSDSMSKKHTYIVNKIILELKYNSNFDKDAGYITNGFPYRITKSSKYVTGFKKIYHRNDIV